MTNWIWITTQKELIHKYPNAPDDVSFLRNDHRHIFHFKIWLEIFHDDRDIEFIMFKRFIDNYLKDQGTVMNHKSCEMISDMIAEHIQLYYPGRESMIEVSEDNENGSLKEYHKQKL